MPTFAYVGRDSAGKRPSGEVAATSPLEAARALRRDGKVVVSVTAASAASAKPDASRAARSKVVDLFLPRVKPEEVRAFAQNLSIMLTTGVSLAEALETCED